MPRYTMRLNPLPLSESELKKIIEDELCQSGWQFVDDHFIPPAIDQNKELIRLSHKLQRIERSKSEVGIVKRFGKALIQQFANGYEINPHKFSPVVIPIDSSHPDNSLFRFATLLWSIPVSQGYARRTRFIIRDEYNGKLVGIFALMDPVFNLQVRDKYIGWDKRQREQYLYRVMDAFVLGAVPPYNLLLGGKMVALAVVSNEVREIIRQKYVGAETIIRKQIKDPSLVLVTTTSALGRSSIYNRISIPSEFGKVYQDIGYSKGWGHYHFSETTFRIIRDWLRSIGDPYADSYSWDKSKSSGPNFRIRVIRRAFDRLGYKEAALKHGVQRQVFLAPLATNFIDILLGIASIPNYFDRPLANLSEMYKDRWMVPRSQRIMDWRSWTIADTWNIITNNMGPYAAEIGQLPLF